MPETKSNVENLAFQLNRLNNELRGIRNVLDQIREQLAWGLQNGRVFLSLVEPDECDSKADAEFEESVIALAIRIQSSLTTFAQDISAVLDEKRIHSPPETQQETEALNPPDAEMNRNSTSNTTISCHARPKVTSLFDDAAFDPVSVKDKKPETTQKDSAKSNTSQRESPESNVNTQQKCLKHAFNSTGGRVSSGAHGPECGSELLLLL